MYAGSDFGPSTAHTCTTSCPRCGYRVFCGTTNSTYTTATAGWNQPSYSNIPFFREIESFSKAVANCLAQLARLHAFRPRPFEPPIPKPQAAMQRQIHQRRKVRTWPTLNEKRMAWGFK